jgi:hypothetical protein
MGGFRSEAGVAVNVSVIENVFGSTDFRRELCTFASHARLQRAIYIIGW